MMMRPDQLPSPNSQRPKQLTLGVGSGELAVDIPLWSMRPASVLMRVVTIVGAVLFGGSSSLLACPQCFGAEETSMIDGAKLGVLVMLAILFAVQGGFVAFFLYLRKRAKRIADIELETEWSELQRSPRTS
jgi:hypothetical protein